MTRQLKWADGERRWERSDAEALEAASREQVEAKVPGSGWLKAQADEPGAQHVSVRLEKPTTPCAPVWVELRLPGGALVRVLPGVDAITFGCLLAVAVGLSARTGSPAAPASQVVACEEGGNDGDAS